MDWKGNITIYMAIIVAALIGLALLSSIADTTTSQTSILTVTNETFSGSNSTPTTLAHPNITTGSLTVITNTTGATFTGNNFTVNTLTGTIQLINKSAGTFYTSYTYKPTNYIPDAGSRGISSLIVVMSALGLLGVILAILYPRLQEQFGSKWFSLKKQEWFKGSKNGVIKGKDIIKVAAGVIIIDSALRLLKDWVSNF
jgi:hypothetical protein